MAAPLSQHRLRIPMPSRSQSSDLPPWGRSFLKVAGGNATLWMRLLDAGCVMLAGYLATVCRWGTWMPPQNDYFAAVAIETAVVVLVFDYFGMYRSWRGRRKGEEVWLLLALTSLAAVLVVVLGFFGSKTAEYSRLWTLAWWGFTVGFLVVYRMMLRGFLSWLRHQGLDGKTVLLVVGNHAGVSVERALQEAAWAGMQVIGWVDDRPEDQKAQSPVSLCLGSVAQLMPAIEARRVDHVWLVYDFKQQDRICQVQALLQNALCDITLVPNLADFHLLNHKVAEVAGLSVLHLSRSPMEGPNRIIKAIEDKIIATIMLVGVSPALVVVAVAVKLSSRGPILFVQERHGWNGQIIRVYKFRSMRLHQDAPGQVTQATRNDSRLTPVGAFLRRTSIDELPQLINVLQGRLSVVGPRPHALAHNEQYKDLVDDYMKRHRVKPGITGWAQMHGFRGETDTLEKMQKRVEYDLWYIQNWSLGLDLKIVWWSCFHGFVQKNAH